MIFAWNEGSDDVFRWWFVMLFFDPIRDVIIGSVERGCRRMLVRIRRVGQNVDGSVGKGGPKVILTRWR